MQIKHMDATEMAEAAALQRENFAHPWSEKDYMEHLELYGDGGTDFRPAFEWVDRLLEQHEFHNLKGLIYFTDGFGIYPQKMPPYKTAFVFMQDNYRDVDVPVWAMKLILDEDDLTESGK